MFRSRDIDDTDDEETETEVEEEEEDEDQHLEENESAFQQHRAAVRSCSDLGDLADMRAQFSALTTHSGLSQAARVRARDLVQLTNDRIAEVRARRITGGR